MEKASDALWQLLLGILDKATLTLGDNRRVDLSQTVIFLTSNLGGGEITELMQGGMGFVQPKAMPAEGLNAKVVRTAVEAARRKFSPEFMNRLDKVVVFHPLKREELVEVLDTELQQVQKRLLDCATSPFRFRITNEGRQFLLQEGTDQRYGARHLKRAIDRYVVYPIARLLATAQVPSGDVLLIDRHSGEERLAFTREAEPCSSLCTHASCGGIFDESCDCRSSSLSECRASNKYQLSLGRTLPFSHPGNRLLDAASASSQTRLQASELQPRTGL